MLRIRQKRRVVFAKPQTQASSSKSTAKSTTTLPATAATAELHQRRSGHTRNGSTVASKPPFQQPPQQPVKVSNRQRRLASLFMALMASSSLPIETDAETLKAAQKASIAPKTSSDAKHKQQFSTVRVQEVRVGRWARFRYGLSRKTRKGKARRGEDVEMDDLIELRAEERGKGSDMS